jgi:hypothetical protein
MKVDHDRMSPVGVPTCPTILALRASDYKKLSSPSPTIPSFLEGQMYILLVSLMYNFWG